MTMSLPTMRVTTTPRTASSHANSSCPEDLVEPRLARPEQLARPGGSGSGRRSGGEHLRGRSRRAAGSHGGAGFGGPGTGGSERVRSGIAQVYGAVSVRPPALSPGADLSPARRPPAGMGGGDEPGGTTRLPIDGEGTDARSGHLQGDEPAARPDAAGRRSHRPGTLSGRLPGPAHQGADRHLRFVAERLRLLPGVAPAKPSSARGQRAAGERRGAAATGPGLPLSERSGDSSTS